MTDPVDRQTQTRDVPETGDIPATAEAQARARIAAAIGRARGALLWEALWPRLVPILATIGLFVALAWLGLFERLPAIPRFGLIGLIAVALLGFAVRLARIAPPADDAPLGRVERESGVPHRPATSFTDRLALGAEDPFARALWQAHRRRALAGLERLAAGWPRPRMPEHDPYGLRLVVPLLLFVGFFAAGPDRLDRLAGAFRLGPAAAVTVARIDAWVTPPAYTDRPPLFLTGAASRTGAAEPLDVPAGSVVTVRIADGPTLAATARGADGTALAPAAPDAAAVPATPAAAAAPDAAAPRETRFTLITDATVAVTGGAEARSWPFTVVPDRVPAIAITRDPQQTAAGALSLGYRISDDYGVVSAEARFEPADPTLAEEGRRPLVAAPTVPLVLPQLRTRSGEAETIRDLAAHPWAGGRVKMTLAARDEAGQEGLSAPFDFVLPARLFRNPIARALVEQRRLLALDAGMRPRVATALDVLTLEPARFETPGPYLALRAAYRRTVEANTDDELREVVDLLWQIALGLEDGDVSLAARDLRAAQDALRQALENGASDEELERLMQELRQAMNAYMEALAREAMRNPQSAQPMDPNTPTLRAEDLQKMLDRLEDLARTGSRDAARQMLSELQQMMENMEAARQQPAPGENSGAMQQQMEQLADMIRRQQQLMDRTFDAERRSGEGSGDGESSMTAEEMRQLLDQLRRDQQALAEQLQQMMEGMQGQNGQEGEAGRQGRQQGEGEQPGGEGAGRLGEAGRAMGEAGRQIGRGRPGDAVGEQGRALQALRDAARGMAEQMARNGQQPGGVRQGSGQPGREDPLGRPQRTQGPDMGSTVKVPDEIDVQRAREILETIRRRLVDPFRLPLERDYLERLLERY
ncbi:TIGR02302 family protein [Prosthecomicrobium pneumaticum]|uniref:Uncharacterized protein (TIGR02302 family) n=1 Tax=Prosthecomicrobium pneumaticum TaxID=81895 RepID=A0A7W9FQG0_9HYPH|nr:TIGR02302 family protein [Prosthecomicrobium pneumaticum]MBB5754960.1 uncharacterized protein (TIGR02302 family) [Prosthecomicrobium pneumaticum]